ncbi:hypothetical protein FPV67DRAFT_1453731 [Lyophyllum atratum]|nr:hypothetical protein FPV67DRAFT_1453731 [Lyophyllum atratum]
MASLSTQEQPATVNGKLDIHSKKAKTLKALEWCKKSVTALELYLGCGNVVEEYEVTGGELDNRRVLENHLGIQVAIGVFAEVEGEVGIALIYANLSISKPTPAIPVPPPAPAPVFSAGVVYLSASADFVRSKESAHSAPPVIPHSTPAISSPLYHRDLIQRQWLITIPSDGVAHNITIEKIKNASQYTWLSGTGSVYFDGSFISCYEVPAVGPDESFDCPLG